MLLSEDEIRSVEGPGAGRGGPEGTAPVSKRMLLGVERGADRLATGRKADSLLPLTISMPLLPEAFRRVRLAFPEDLLPSCTDAAC